MTVTGESRYVGCRNGVKKDTGKPWYNLRFLDIEAAEIFTIFTDEEKYSAMCNCPKNTPVVLTLELVPGERYVTLVSVEIIEK